MVETGGPQPGGQSTELPHGPPAWVLAHGVGLIEGALVGSDEPGGHVFVIVRPDGRRFQVSEPLYRLAELLQGRLSADQVAARLSERLGRSLGASDVATLVETKLAPQGVVRALDTPIT
jgi:hypothetical protein